MSSNSLYMTPYAYPLDVPPTHGVPNQAIDSLLGRGLTAVEWQKELEGMHYTWKPILRSIMIRRELWYFKDEIEELVALPNTNMGPGPKSNSCRSILLRIQGKTGEREQRLMRQRLCGPEISCRTLESHVKQWRSEAATTPHLSSLPASINMGIDNHDMALSTGLTNYNPQTSFSLPLAVFTNISMGPNIQQASYSLEPSSSNANNLRSGDLGFDSNTWTFSQTFETSTVPPFNMALGRDSLVTPSFLSTTASEIDTSRTYSSLSAPVTTTMQEIGPLSTVLETAFEGLHSNLCSCERCFPTETR